MKIPSGSLEAFLEVARLKSFTKAAVKLGLTQSALSQRILNLEEAMEASYFIRDRAGARLTEAGEELLRYAQSQESLEEEFLGAKRAGSTEALVGTLRIAGFSSVVRSLLLPAVAPLLREHSAHCSIITREMKDLPSLLQRGEADLLLINQDLARPNVVSHFLGFEENVWVKGRRAIGPQAGSWFLDHEADDDTTARYFKKFGSKPKRLQRRFLDDVYLLIEGVKMGLGEAIIPRHLLQGERDLEICEPSKILREPIWLIYPQQGFYSRLHKRAVADILREFHKNLPQK